MNVFLAPSGEIFMSRKIKVCVETPRIRKVSFSEIAAFCRDFINLSIFRRAQKPPTKVEK